MVASIALITLTAVFAGACDHATTAQNDRRTQNVAALARARGNIEKLRRGPARIRVVGANGKPAPNIKLNVRLVSHAFKFGCYLKIDDLDPGKLPAYERQFRKLFNYAVIGNYWDNIESSRGGENWTWFDREVELGKKLGLEIAVAPVLWGTSEFGTPRWLPHKREDLLPILERRVRSSVTRSPSIADVQVVNEPLARREDLFARVAGDDYIASAFDWAKSAGNNKRLIINEYGVFGSVSEHNYNRDTYFRLLERLAVKGVPIDVIGIQAHANGEWFEPANVAEQLERYAALGKDIQITEFSAQTHEYSDKNSPMRITGGYENGAWDAEKQARFYREFYTIAFGSPRVEAIVTWGLDDERAWLPGVGLIAENGEMKPAYRELDRLINHEWNTRVEATTDGSGMIAFAGFFGEYEITTATAAGRTAKSRFTLSREKPGEWLIRLSS